MKPILVVLVVLSFLSACNVPENLTDTVTFPLKEFVMEGDRAFSYEGVETVDGETWTEYRIKRRIGSFPHFITTGNADEFFETDSRMFYWNDLRGDSYLRYVPNGNHGLW